VPAALEKRAPAVFEKCSMTKDVVRFTSPALELLKQDLAAANEANEAALQVQPAPTTTTSHALASVRAYTSSGEAQCSLSRFLA